MGIAIPIDDSIIHAYLAGQPTADYAGHWVFREAQGGLVDGGHAFTPPPGGYEAEVARLLEAMRDALADFTFRNDALVAALFADTLPLLGQAVVLPAVGLFGDAMALLHEGTAYAVFDLIHMANNVRAGKDISDLLHNLLTHELCHVLIGLRYPPSSFGYADYLDWISFQEGFAHLLSYREDVALYRPDDAYAERFERNRRRLEAALGENDPALQKQYSREANMGSYWEKFGAISAMLYLMRHMDGIKDTYDAGWQGFCKKVAAYRWL